MSRGVRDDIETLRAREKAREFGKIGDKVGYSVMQLRARHWVETHCPTLDTITQAEGMLRQYQHAEPEVTFAIARLELVMISRPDVTK